MSGTAGSKAAASEASGNHTLVREITINEPADCVSSADRSRTDGGAAGNEGAPPGGAHGLRSAQGVSRD
jgi:hypothetical protein